MSALRSLAVSTLTLIIALAPTALATTETETAAASESAAASEAEAEAGAEAEAEAEPESESESESEPEPESKDPARVSPSWVELSEEPETGAADTGGARDEPEGAYVPSRFGFEIGMRTLVIDDEGFDPYSDNNLMGQVAVVVRGVPLHLGRFGLAINAEYNYGGKSHSARGQAAELKHHRIGGGLEAYFDVWRMQLFVRGTPAANYLNGVIAALPDLESESWIWSFDATGGFRFRLGTAGTEMKPYARFYLMAEAGYSFAGDADMTYTAEDEDNPSRQFGNISLPQLTPDGFVNRVAFAVSF